MKRYPATWPESHPWFHTCVGATVSVLAALLLMTSTILAQTGGGYDLSWNSIDGGGQTSSGDGYTLSGTAGQPDAGALTGGQFSLGGGFWTGGVTVVPNAYCTYLPMVVREHAQLYIVLGGTDLPHGMSREEAGDANTEVVMAGDPAVEARRTGDGRVLPSSDGNTVPDHFMRFGVDDNYLYAGEPTMRVVVEIEYLDEGEDLFGMQYDAVDNRMKDVPWVAKSDSGRWRTVRFVLEDAFFANRVHGLDFRLDDHSDGAETIRRVGVTLLPGLRANP